MTQVPGWTKLSLNCIVWHSTCNKTDCASICTCNNASKATLGSISIFQYTHFQHPLTRALQLLYEHRRAFFSFFFLFKTPVWQSRSMLETPCNTTNNHTNCFYEGGLHNSYESSTKCSRVLKRWGGKRQHFHDQHGFLWQEFFELVFAPEGALFVPPLAEAVWDQNSELLSI